MLFEMGSTDSPSFLKWILLNWCRLHFVLSPNYFLRLWQDLSREIWENVKSKTWIRKGRSSHNKTSRRQEEPVCNDSSNFEIHRVRLDFSNLLFRISDLMCFWPDCFDRWSLWQNRMRWNGRKYSVIHLPSVFEIVIMLFAWLYCDVDSVQWDWVHEAYRKVLDLRSNQSWEKRDRKNRESEEENGRERGGCWSRQSSKILGLSSEWKSFKPFVDWGTKSLNDRTIQSSNLNRWETETTDLWWKAIKKNGDEQSWWSS